MPLLLPRTRKSRSTYCESKALKSRKEECAGEVK
jgi:hypothetical protein